MIYSHVFHIMQCLQKRNQNCQRLVTTTGWLWKTPDCYCIYSRWTIVVTSLWDFWFPYVHVSNETWYVMIHALLVLLITMMFLYPKANKRSIYLSKFIYTVQFNLDIQDFWCTPCASRNLCGNNRWRRTCDTVTRLRMRLGTATGRSSHSTAKWSYLDQPVSTRPLKLMGLPLAIEPAERQETIVSHLHFNFTNVKMLLRSNAYW